jgi:hypothetical protein
MLLQTVQTVPGRSLLATSPGRALRAHSFAALLLPHSLRLRFPTRSLSPDIATDGRAGLDAKNSLTPIHLDGDAPPFGTLGDLFGPARILTLVRNGDLCRLALAHETEDGLPIDIIIVIVIRNV